MKKLYFLSFVMMLSFIFLSCKVNDSDNTNDPNSLGGDTNVPMGQVGNTGSFGTVVIGTKTIDIKSSLEVLKNEGGVATIKLTADLSTDASLSAINNWIPKSAKDSSGKISIQFKSKITADGIQTYFLGDNPHTLVKYADNVGAQYSSTRSDGITYTRTVTAKSDQDDYPYGFMYIKTMTVEQTDTKMAGIKKIVFKLNHKYGLVNIAFVADDGSSVNAYMYSKN